MSNEIKTRPLTLTEQKYTYAQSMQLEGQTGTIGHLRGDFATTGYGFYATWFDTRPQWKSDEFKADLDTVINALREDKGLLHNRYDMSAFARHFPESAIKGNYCTEYGFRVDTEKHAFLLRCNPTKGDYNFYCYCYVKEWLDKHIQKAEQGIRFIDPQYKELFRIPDGGKVIVTTSWGEKREYVINEEQAETVRMIYDLYLQGYGSMKIAKILTERKRKTASGLIKWSVSNIMRAIKNATYTGTKCYNKSRSNNFLEQKRINNLDMSTYEYVEGDFPSIISQEIWDKAQAIRESRVKPVCVSAGKNTHSKRDSRDIWVNKLRCSCGSSYRKNKWHTKLDGKTSYGYQCYNQLNNGIKRKRAEIGLDTEGYCDSRMITDWKLDFMAKALLEHLWTERKESVLIALDLIKYYYKEEKSNETQSDTVTIQAKLDKANSRLTNLIAMRADGEISKDEYQAMRSPVDEEIKKLQKALDEIPQEKSNPKGLDIEGIRSTLNSFIDFSGSTISHDVVNQFVYLITPTSDTTFDWYVNLNGTADVKATFTAEGRKKNCIIKLEEIEKISSVHREKNEDNAHFIKNPHIFTYLHRLPSANSANEKLTQQRRQNN